MGSGNRYIKPPDAVSEIQTRKISTPWPEYKKIPHLEGKDEAHLRVIFSSLITAKHHQYVFFRRKQDANSMKGKSRKVFLKVAIISTSPDHLPHPQRGPAFFLSANDFRPSGAGKRPSKAITGEKT